MDSRIEEILKEKVGDPYEEVPIMSRIEELLSRLDTSGGGGGTSNYNQLSNKPSINNVSLQGNKSLSDLGLYSKSEVDALVSGGNAYINYAIPFLDEQIYGIVYISDGVHIELDFAHTTYIFYANLEESEEDEHIPIAIGDINILSSSDNNPLVNTPIFVRACPPGGSENTYFATVKYYYDERQEALAYDYGNGVTINENGTLYIREISVLLSIKSGYVMQEEGISFGVEIYPANNVPEYFVPYIVPQPVASELPFTIRQLVENIENNLPNSQDINSYLNQLSYATYINFLVVCLGDRSSGDPYVAFDGQEHTVTISGMEFKIGAHNEVAVKGTATSDIRFCVAEGLRYSDMRSATKIYFSMCPPGGSENTYFAELVDPVNNLYYYDYGEGCEEDGTMVYYCGYINIKEGVTFSNYVWFAPRLHVSHGKFSTPTPWFNNVSFTNPELTERILALEETVRQLQNQLNP